MLLFTGGLLVVAALVLCEVKPSASVRAVASKQVDAVPDLPRQRGEWMITPYLQDLANWVAKALDDTEDIDYWMLRYQVVSEDDRWLAFERQSMRDSWRYLKFKLNDVVLVPEP